MNLSKRAFVDCPLVNKDVPKDDCGGCDWNIRTASGINKCGFCKLSRRDKKIIQISERHDLLDEYLENNEE
jgi:hypothetical protein